VARRDSAGEATERPLDRAANPEVLPMRGRLRTVVSFWGWSTTGPARPVRSRRAGQQSSGRRSRPRPGPRCLRARLTAHRELIALQGQIVKGKVVRLEEYGAFVEVTTEEGQTVTGLVHVSEVSTEFVENIYAELAEGDEVEVKVLDIKDDGKVDLSIKRADPDWQDEESVNLRSKLDKDFNKRLRRFMHKSQMIQGEARRQKRGRVDS
jgi:S1 RNA binding domain protein